MFSTIVLASSTILYTAQKASQIYVNYFVRICSHGELQWLHIICDSMVNNVS